MFYLEISISIGVYSVPFIIISEHNPTIPLAYRYCVDIKPYQKDSSNNLVLRTHSSCHKFRGTVKKTKKLQARSQRVGREAVPMMG